MGPGGVRAEKPPILYSFGSLCRSDDRRQLSLCIIALFCGVRSRPFRERSWKAVTGDVCSRDRFHAVLGLDIGTNRQEVCPDGFHLAIRVSCVGACDRRTKIFAFAYVWAV